MRIFVTGATGFIGSALVPELIQAGHQVIGMTRSDAGAQALAAAGAEVHRGTLEDTESLRSGAAKGDAVIHLAFDHDFSRFVDNCEKDRRAIAALGSALAGSDRPLLLTSGTGAGSRGDGQPASEDVFNAAHANPRIASEMAGHALLEAGVNVSVMRLPQVHNPFRQGLITPLIEIVREKRVSAYVEDGLNRWPAGHLSDVVRLYRLAIEKAVGGAKLHGVAEEGVPFREIAEVIGRRLNIPVVSLSPEEAANHFGWFAHFAGIDSPASSLWTREQMGWEPKEIRLIADIDRPSYFVV